MGLAASQTRLLSLTQRQHTVEHKAQYLQAQKLRLGMDSDSIYEKFIAAMDSTKLQTKTYSSDGKVNWVDASIENVMHTTRNYTGAEKSFFAQDMKTGKLYIPNKFAKAYEDADGDIITFVQKLGLKATPDAHTDRYEQALFYVNEAINAGWDNPTSGYFDEFIYRQNEFINTDQKTYTKYENQPLGEHFEDIFNAIKKAGGYIAIDEKQSKSNSWLTNMVKNSVVVLTGYNRTKEDLDATASLNLYIKEISNEKEISTAELEYETSLKEIQDKEKKYTTQLNKLENERSAIETEIQSLKSVAKENIQSTFKIFS